MADLTYADAQLQATKAINNVDMVLRSYRLGAWPADYKADLIHDLGVKLAHRDLDYVRVEVLAPDRTVVYRHEERFLANGHGGRRFDSSRGLELPVLDRALAADYRLIISGGQREDEYRHLLRLPWTPAERLQDRAGSSFAGEHTAAITGGRTAAEVFVSDESRHQGTLIRMGAAYGFIRDDQVGNVFVHTNFCAPGTALVLGRRYDYIAIQTPRGVQARDVREAA